MSKKYTDEEWLREKYVDEGMSDKEISEVCNVSNATICRNRNKMDIEARDELTEKQRQKISQSVSEHLEENGHPFEGQTHTEETKEIMSEKQSGKNNNLYGEDGGDKYDNTFIVLCKDCHKSNYDFWHDSSVEEQLNTLGD